MANFWRSALWMFSLGASAGALAMPCELPEDGKPATIKFLADSSAACFQALDQAKASKIFYAAMIRARAISEAVGGDSTASAKALQAQLGGPANRWLGGDIDQWRASIQWALDWEAGSEWPEASKLGSAAPESLKRRDKARSALAKMLADLAAIDKKAFYAKRREVGLEVREPGFEPPADSKPGAPGRSAPK